MLIKGEDEGGFSPGEGKSAEQGSFFQTKVCAAEFHQKSVQFGSRPVKRARLLSDTDGPVKEAQLSSCDSRGFAHGDFLEERNGMPQAHQGDQPISERSSVVTNGFRLRSAGVKVAGPIHVQNGVYTKTISGQKPGAHEDEKRLGLLNHENYTNGNAGCMIPTSTSGDEGLFVIQVRSPTSKQLLHGRKQSNGQEELHTCIGQARSKPAKPHDHEDGRKDQREEEAGVNSCEIRNVYVRKRKRSTPGAEVVATVDAVPAQEHGSSQLEERLIKHYVRRVYRQTESHSPADMTEKPCEGVMTSSSNGGKEAINSEHHRDDVETQGTFNVFQRRSKMKKLPEAEHHHTEISGRVNLNVFQRRSKMNHVSQAEHDADVSTAKVAEREGILNVFQRRPMKNQLLEAEHHKDTSTRVEREGNLNVFQRRAKMNHLSQHVDISTPKAVVGAESQGNLNVFRRRSKLNQLPKAEHRADVETAGNLHVFQRRSKKSNLSQKEPCRNDNIGHQKGVKEKHIPAGYVRADHQPNWLPEGWNLEIREGKSTAHPRDKYYHDTKSGRIFRSKNDVLQFLVDGRVGSGSQVIMSDGSGMKAQLQNKKRPVPVAPVQQTGFQSPLSSTPWYGAIGTGTGIGTGERSQGHTLGKDAGAAELNGGAAANSPQLLSSGDGIPLPNGSPVCTVKSPSGDKENRGKLIFRLKRKQPDLEGGKGRSKRPMYEVVHGEKASSSTSTATNQEKTLPTRERTGQDVTPTSGSDLQRIISSVKESLSPINVVSGSMPVKAQVEKHIPLEKPSFTSPGSLVMPTVSNWGIKHNPSEHVELLQQEPYTALGIPATARYSGLQQMASYSANHTHVFLDPTIPLSWQYPFTISVSASVPASVLPLGPFIPSVSKPFSSTVPIPVCENNPGVSSLKNLNATATIFPCSESGVDSRTMDSAKLAEGGPQVHKAPKAPKPLTKSDHTKLFLDLGRRLCLTGVTRNPESVGTLKPQIPVTNLEAVGLVDRNRG